MTRCIRRAAKLAQPTHHFLPHHRPILPFHSLMKGSAGVFRLTKKTYNLKPLPTNPNTVTLSTDDNDFSSDENVKLIKRNYFLNSIALLRRFPGSQNWAFKAAVVRKVSNPTGILDLLRELVCRQTKVAFSSSSPSLRIL